MGTPFWGRTQELDEAVAGLRRVPQGLGFSLALVGEPGIGKTRFATEVAEQATVLGFQACWGRTWEAGGAPALWPWRQLLEAMGVEARPGPLELVWSPPDAVEFSASDTRQARFELFDAVVRALREQGGRRPTLCVLDDLHAADIASLELTDFAVSALKASPIAWVLTYRDAEAERLPVRDLLARASRRCTVLPLRRLSREDSGALVKGLLPRSDAQLADALFRATSGNPLFLCETARALAEGRSAVGADGQLPVGQGVALVVRDRVASLSAGARALVEVGAVLGREAPLDVLSAAAELEPSRARAFATEVAASGLWAEAAPHRWLFSHALVRDALYRELGDERRVALHAKVAAALDGLVTAGRTELQIARAMHALEAQLVCDPEQIARWVLAASHQARAQRSFEEVATLLERACRELTVSDAARLPLLLALGSSWGDLGNNAALQKTFDEAIEIARRIGEPGELARAVLGRASVYVLGAVRTELLHLIDEALERLPASERELRARLQARKASAMTPAADPAEPVRLARAALSSIAGSTDDRAMMDVALAAGAALGDFVPPAERLDVNAMLVRTARNAGDRVLELRGLSRLVTDHMEAGDVARADAVLLERDALASSLGHPRFRWQTPLFRSMRSMIEGRFDECMQSVEDARRLVAVAEDDNAWRVLAVHEAWLLLLQDRTDLLRALEPELLRRIDGMPAYPDLMRALVLARSGHASTARIHLLRAVGEELYGVRATHLLVAVAETAVLCGALDVARKAYPLLLSRAGSNASAGLFAIYCGPPVAGYLGMTANAIGRPDEETRAHFDAALERTAAMGASAHETWVKTWLRAHRRDEKPAAPAPTTPEAAADFVLRPHDAGWELARGTTSLVMKDLRGMGMLAKLLARPGEEIHAVELVSGDADDVERVDAGDAGEMLDEKARLAYRKRIEELSERVEDAEERGDALKAERARAELEALSRELSRAVGIGGRARRAGSVTEKARITAQRRLREAIRRIGELDAEVGAILDRTIRTGTFCCYEPNRRPRS